MGKEILPHDQSRITEQAKFTYSLLGKAFEKQTKTIKDQGKNNLRLYLKVLKRILKNKQNPEIVND